MNRKLLPLSISIALSLSVFIIYLLKDETISDSGFSNFAAAKLTKTASENNTVVSPVGPEELTVSASQSSIEKGFIIKSPYAILDFLREHNAVGRHYFTKSEVPKLSDQPAVIQLKGAIFELDKNHIPFIDGDREYIYLKTTQALGIAESKILSDLGISVENFIYKNTWIVNVTAEQVKSLSSLSFVSALGNRDLKDKVDPNILEKGFSTIDTSHQTLQLSAEVYHNGELNQLINHVLENGWIEDRADIQSSGQKSVVMNISAEYLERLVALNIVSWIEGAPYENQTNNLAAGTLSNVDQVKLEFFLDGAGIILGIWDGGAVNANHTDFGARVNLQPDVVDATTLSAHATHVAGTMIGSGLSEANAEGMAIAANLDSFDFYDDVNEMRTAANRADDPVEISNHSYGTRVGWSIINGGWVFVDNQELFGDYNAQAREWDQIVADTDLVVIKAAGNDRGDGVIEETAAQPRDGGVTGYDTIPTYSNAKNILTVGATEDDGLTTTNFSGWGPVDGGRIKPDIVADGTNTLSTSEQLSGTDHRILSGTSMASPVITGSAALLSQRFQQVFLQPPEASMLKAILLHSAQDRGDTGPDYQFGWGLLDLAQAVDTVNLGALNLFSASVTNANALAFQFVVNASTDEFKITTVWTDPAGTAGAVQALVNDIDIRLSSPSGVDFFPWVKDETVPATPATRGVNTVDNVEQILVDQPEQGLWTLTVATNGLGAGNQQQVNIVSSYAQLGQDSDNDWLPDTFEITMGLDPNNGDIDNDGLTDYQEVCLDGDCEVYSPYPNGRDSDASLADTDGDGLNDGDELNVGRNPVVNEPVLVSIIIGLLLG
ncbi:MAG: S8 family serine peptidase [Pseudomonadales bacterium]|nr:S8 family serine peptidase [Pseudomonadales bacterium]